MHKKTGLINASNVCLELPHELRKEGLVKALFTIPI